eukprot:Pgem_evm1s11541
MTRKKPIRRKNTPLELGDDVTIDVSDTEASTSDEENTSHQFTRIKKKHLSDSDLDNSYDFAPIKNNDKKKTKYKNHSFTPLSTEDRKIASTHKEKELARTSSRKQTLQKSSK